MSKIDLISKSWCDLVFADKNKEYGAYRIRANAGKRQLRALIIILVLVAAIALIPFVIGIVNSGKKAETFTDETAMANLQKENKKPKEEKKEEIHYMKKETNKVAVKASIQFTAPVIKADDQIDHSAELKSQDNLFLNKGDVSFKDYKGDENAQTSMNDLKINQSTGGTGKGGNGDGDGPGGDGVMTTVEQPPTFPGGEAALLRYISTHLKYPQAALEQELQGTISLRFVVETNGSIGDVQVVKSFGDKSCEKEAVRVVKSLPRFIPGKMQGRAVRVWYTVPIRFMIQ